MKRFFILLVSAALFASSGCDNGDCMIWDFTCYDICFWVTDAEGNNLMDPEVEGNVLDSEIYVEYKGKSYPINAIATRYNMPHWEGLRTGTYDSETQPVMLMFGEFSPEGDYKGETFTIHWGDGSSDEVKFDMYITWHKCDPTVHKKLWFNGEPVSDDSFIIEVIK